MLIWGKTILPELDIGDGDNDKGGKDHAGDSYNGVQMIDSTRSCFIFLAISKIESN